MNRDEEIFHIRNETAISEIVRSVRDGHYCTILGPPYCDKGLLLKDVKSRLEESGDEVCVLLDLGKIDFTADEDFLAEFAGMLRMRLQKKAGRELPPSPDKIKTEHSLKVFLQNYVKLLKRDLVLLIDNIERIRIGPLKSLLKVLRAVFIEHEENTPGRLGVVTVSRLILADLALGPHSPFNIARITVVKDLTETESEELINHLLGGKKVDITPEGRERCIQATKGDRHLIARLCYRCVEVIGKEKRKQVTEQDIEQAIQWFLNEMADNHAPLLETIRSIEANPSAMVNVLKILRQGYVLRRDLEINLEAATDTDELQLTGAVRVEANEDQKTYYIRNEIYKNYLEKHFNPDRIALVFGMIGRWDKTIPYLAQLQMDNPQYRSSLLSMVINSIYTSKSIVEACEHLINSLPRAFAISKARIYIVSSERSHLEPVGQLGFEKQDITKLSLVENHPETSAYLGEDYSVTYSDTAEKVVFIPLKREGGGRLGLAAVYGLDADPIHDKFLQLLAFLEQATRAIGNIIDRERKLKQLATLYVAGKQITSSLDLKQVLQTTIKVAIATVPAAEKGALFLWDEKNQKLIIHSFQGFRDDIVAEMQLNEGEGLAGWVYKKGEPLLIGDALADSRMKKIDHPDIKDKKSSILVPLEAWGRVMGVLCLDNITICNAFRESDLFLLSIFGAQAAIAIQNANLNTTLYELGLKINQGDLKPEEIFAEVVRSITQVSGSVGANMHLLRDTDDPELSVSQDPILSASYGLAVDYEKMEKPRPRGLTFRVLETRKPQWVSNPKEAPGIHPLALESGVQARLCLPMMIQNSIIGILFVHYKKPHKFTENEIEMLSLFTNQAALAIDNARQREELTMTKAVAWMGLVNTNLAHSITQKAGAIRNTVGGLRRLLKDRPEITERLDRIDTYAQMVVDIPSRALLPYEDQVEPVNLNEILREEIQRWNRPEDGIEIDFSGLESIEVPVLADPRWLKVVLEMLTMNAVRAAKGSSNKRVSIKSQTRGWRVVVEITNTGKMIPEEVKKMLFKKPIPRNQGAEGSGVGLLIARTIIRRYGGDIELLRTSPVETTFSFWLPLYQKSNK